MMNITQWMMCKIAEEAAEVGQRAMKSQQFGCEEVQPDQPKNNEMRLQEEIWDLIVTAREAGFDPVPPEDYSLKRVAKMNKFLQLSISEGQVTQ